MRRSLCSDANYAGDRSFNRFVVRICDGTASNYGSECTPINQAKRNNQFLLAPSDLPPPPLSSSQPPPLLALFRPPPSLLLLYLFLYSILNSILNSTQFHNLACDVIENVHYLAVPNDCSIVYRRGKRGPNHSSIVSI